MTTKSLYTFGLFTLVTFCFQCNSPPQTEGISFYSVPLKCGAATDIGCGSRIKPLFIDTEKEKSIKESWTSRQGTVIAIIWSERENERLIQSLFSKYDIEAKLILDSTKVKKWPLLFVKKGNG